jgi:hypothetical protein
MSAERQLISGSSQSSVLKIECESEAKAQLVLAKYLSDLGLLPGVTTTPLDTARGTLAAHQIEGQGIIAAARCGLKVYIFTAADASSLKSLYEGSLPADAKVNATEAEIAVPMYLDRWDKYGFSFYYAPFARSQTSAGRNVPDYDKAQDFDFAEKSGHAGFAMWENANGQDTAEGTMDTATWSWALDGMKKRGLPLGVNFGIWNPCWIFNRYRDQQLQGQPQYIGGWYGLIPSGPMLLSWNAAETENKLMVQLQQTVRRFKDVDNIVSWMEPHEEMGHGAPDELVDYGPQADIGYREFLKSKYGTLDAVAKRWGMTFQTWDDVHVPELASFMGWNKEAIDLTGPWRVNLQAPFDATAASPQLDDSSWPTIEAPGNFAALFLPRKPAVYRRHITIDPAWRSAHDKVWLYVWDLNDNRDPAQGGKSVQIFVNGKEVTETPPYKDQEHWAAVDVASALTAGDNVITVILPWGFMDYRAYLSPQPPKQYPDLGPQLNAQWADFSDWGSWSRGLAVRRGVRMIRQVDPNRPVTLASPYTYMSDMKSIAEDYGCVFHDTGGMAGVWINWPSMYMASSGLAMDAEPGSGAVDVPDFKRFMGRWSTEGIQGVDYFQDISDISWNDPIRDYFGQTLHLWHLIGKYHTPKAGIAALVSDRMDRLTGFPWHPDPKIVQRGGFNAVPVYAWLRDSYPVDAVVEDDFKRGNVASYKVIIDTNTEIMDKPFIDQIEKWVRAGGIFVACSQSGRHTSSEMDAWPMKRLTGYSIVKDIGNTPTNLAPGQTMLKDDYWSKPHNAYGQSLHKEMADCQDLLLWEDGSTAIGMRPLGKGYVIDVGATPSPMQTYKDIATRAGVEATRATAKDVLLRHFVSNNGLYDVWSMWNENGKPVTTDLVFRNGLNPATAIDVKTGATVAIQQGPDGAKIPGLKFDGWETHVFLTPRCAIASAPSDWFDLQRHWWKGTTDPGTAPPPFIAKNSVPLESDWAFKALDAVAQNAQPPDSAKWTDPKLDDSAWPREYLGVLNSVNHPGVKHGIFRKHFTLPPEWKGGDVILWAEMGPGNGRVFLDGKLQTNGIEKGGDLTDALKAGGEHVLAYEVWGDQTVFGPIGMAWIAFRPTPAFHQDLSGDWDVSPDVLTHTMMSLPGKWDGSTARRLVDIPGDQAGRNVVVRVVSSPGAVPFAGVIVNGHFVTHVMRNIELQFNLNVTPYIKFGQKNEIVLAGGRNTATLSEIALDYYDKNAYP